MAENNIVIKNPLGQSVTYGEYDNILVTSSDGSKLNYSKLPEVTVEDDGKVLGVVNGIWDKMEAEFSSGDGSGGGSNCDCPTGTVSTPFAINWDTSVTPTVTFDIAAAGYTCYKVSDTTPSKEQMMSANWSLSNDSGDIVYDSTLTGTNVVAENNDAIILMVSSAGGCGLLIAFNSGETTINAFGSDFTLNIPETGIYVIWSTSQTLPTTMFGSMTYMVEQEVNFVQSDWNQNDSTKPDYVKNRPFYSANAILFDNEFEVSEDGEYYFEDTSATNLVAGQTYTYVFGGQNYTSTCVAVEDMLCIGNVGALSSGVDNGEPIVVIRSVYDSAWMVFIVYDPTDYVVDGKLSLTISGDITKPLNVSYIPDIPWSKIANKPFGDIPAGTVVCEETVIAGSFSGNDHQGFAPLSSLVKNAVIVGTNYNVEINGTMYTGTCVSTDFGSTVSIVDSNLNEVAGIFVDLYGFGSMLTTVSQYIANGTSCDVKVTLVEAAVVKIDSTYLPDDLSGLPESTESDNGKVLTVGSDGTAEWSTGLPMVSSGDDGKILSVEAGTWSVIDNPVPKVTTDDNGKFLRVVGGAWASVSISNAEEVSF